MLIKELPFLDPIHIFNLVANDYGTVFLDSNMQNDQYGQYSLLAISPIKQFIASNEKSFYEELEQFKRLFNQNNLSDNLKYPFLGGLIGFLSYDLNNSFENISNTNNTIIPNYHFGLYNQMFLFDLINKICTLIVLPINGFNLNYIHQLNKLQKIYEKAQQTQHIAYTSNYKQQLFFKSNFTKHEYISTVNKAKDYIYQGDIFEVNIAQRFFTNELINFDAISSYHKLRKINQAPFSAYLNFEPLKIMSASPERFIKINNRKIETRPIKGTIKRDVDHIKDQQLIHQLANSTKDIAENIMIVDLMRNDFAKICQPHSVVVKQLCQVESFTNLHHLVSVITGTLNETTNIFDIIPTCFPGGSITGAPKIRAMQIINELEPDKRGVYCGSIGYFSFNQNVDLSIAIRTLILKHNHLSFYVGGAITLDSNPLDEYNETLLKGQKIFEVFK